MIPIIIIICTTDSIVQVLSINIPSHVVVLSSSILLLFWLRCEYNERASKQSIGSDLGAKKRLLRKGEKEEKKVPEKHVLETKNNKKDQRSIELRTVYI